MGKPAPMHLQRVAQLIDEGNRLLSQNQLVAAEQRYRQVISAAPRVPEAHNNLGTVLKEQGQIDAARRCFERALQLRPHYASAHSNLLFTLHYAPGQTLSGLRAAHESWAKTQLAGVRASELVPASAGAGAPLTVGLVSPDLYYHPVGCFLLPWLQHHDRTRFRLVAYADSPRVDGMTRRLQAQVALWRHVHGQPDEAVHDTIRGDGVDILVDLAGHTAGNRLRLFARRAAPWQVSWLGYSATTAVPAMDFVLMDASSAPPGYEAFFTERLVRVSGLRFCYSPPEYAPPVAPAPVTRSGNVTFGSFNNLAKLTPEVLATWAAILQGVPGSRLVLKWKALGDAATADRIRSEFARHGVSADRIECRAWSQHPQMLAEYGDVDIALDPFPFSGGLTSCDALYMGVPVLTMPGELPIARQTAGFLDALGLPEWIIGGRDAYIASAIAFASDHAALETLRRTMRSRMLAARLCDGPSHARSIEHALLTISRAHGSLDNPSRKGIS